MNRRVFVTGGGTGIGAAIVRDLVAAEYEVDFTYNQSLADVEVLLRLTAGRARAIQCDFRDPEQLKVMTSRLESLDTPYYGFVHNSGVAANGLAAAINVDDAMALMSVNFWSFVQITKALVMPMQRAKEGRLIVMSSIAATRGWRGNAAYAASKAALEAYCRCLVDEVSRKGITVNCIAPGVISTRMVGSEALRESSELIARRVPSRRAGRVEDVARLVRFLLEPLNSYVTGTTVAVDGGVNATLGFV